MASFVLWNVIWLAVADKFSFISSITTKVFYLKIITENNSRVNFNTVSFHNRYRWCPMHSVRGKNKERISPQIEANESHSNLLGAICVLPASIVICVGKLSDFALSWQIKQNIIDGTVIDCIF